MKCFFLILILLAIFLGSSGVVYLRSRNIRGPRTWRGGVECMKSIASFYFQEARVLRTKAITMVRFTNLTSPAREISLEFAGIVNSLVEKEFLKDSLIRVSSDAQVVEKNFNKYYFKPIVPSDYYIIVTDSNTNIIKFIDDTLRKTIAWNPRAKFLIIFNNSRSSIVNANLGSFVESFLKDLHDKFDISNVVYAFSTGVVTYEIFSSKLYQRNKEGQCEKVVARRLESCSDGKIQGLMRLQEEALETSIMTLNDCNLKICCAESPPFVDKGCKTGVEMSIIQIIRDQMQFHPQIICTNMTRGEIEDGKPSDLLGELVARKCDLLVGSFFPDNDLEDFGQSVTYLEDSYTWFVPLADHRAPWKGLLVIFLTSTWLLLIFSLLCTGTMWYILGRFSPREDHHHKLIILCLLNAWQVLLGISANNRPKFIPLRIVFLTLALYGLNIATIYTSKLITVFTTPAFDDQIDSLEKILSSGLPFGGRIEYLDWFENDEPMDKTIAKRYNHSANFQPTIANLKRVSEGKQILLANRMFVLSNNYKSLIFGFPENVFSNPMEIITTKGFPLLTDFNEIISMLKDSGISFKLYVDFMYNITILSRIRSHDEMEIEDTVLTVRHLQGAFIILMYGLVLSIAVFATELIRHRWFSTE